MDCAIRKILGLFKLVCDCATTGMNLCVPYATRTPTYTRPLSLVQALSVIPGLKWSIIDWESVRCSSEKRKEKNESMQVEEAPDIHGRKRNE
jgi:hypothetical protein